MRSSRESFCAPLADEDATEILDGLSRFCALGARAGASEIDESRSLRHATLTGSREHGHHGLNLPERFGGIGLRPTVLFEAVARLAGACASTASMVTAHWLATDLLLIADHGATRGSCCAMPPLAGSWGLRSDRARTPARTRPR